MRISKAQKQQDTPTITTTPAFQGLLTFEKFIQAVLSPHLCLSLLQSQFFCQLALQLSLWVLSCRCLCT